MFPDETMIWLVLIVLMGTRMTRMLLRGGATLGTRSVILTWPEMCKVLFLNTPNGPGHDAWLDKFASAKTGSGASRGCPVDGKAAMRSFESPSRMSKMNVIPLLLP